MSAVLPAPPAVDALVASAGRGDEGAFDALIGPHVDVAFRLAVTILHDRAEAEDAVQEATLKAWRAIGRLRPGSNVRAWFLTIVANQCRSQRRGRWWSLVRLADTERHGSAAADDVVVARTDLARALARLSADDRLAVYLRYYEDLPLDEVAAVSGISLAAARSRVSRAVGRLRLQLEEAP